MKGVLAAAGLYNLVWGAWVILSPGAIFQLTGLTEPLYPQIWQCVGMIVGVYGIGYLIAATNPLRHWPIVLVGLLGKIFGPIGFVSAFLAGDLPLSWGATILTNDLIWWVPFGAILYNAFRAANDTSATTPIREVADATHTFRSHRGATIHELSSSDPLLLLFVRHAGCTFCREALSDLARVRDDIEQQGVQLAIVHMSRPMEATQMMEKYGLDDVHRFHDPHCVLYRAFGVPRGSFGQLLGPRVWWPGFRAAVVERHGIGKLAGDGFRMAAAFLLRDGRPVAEQRTATSAERFDFRHLVQCASCDSAAQDSRVLEAASHH
jgi:peroxiredoxin